jgi:hypothetical protein
MGGLYICDIVLKCILICNRRRTACCMHGKAAKKKKGVEVSRNSAFLYTHRGAHTVLTLSIATVVQGIALHCITRRKTDPGNFHLKWTLLLLQTNSLLL